MPTKKTVPVKKHKRSKPGGQRKTTDVVKHKRSKPSG